MASRTRSLIANLALAAVVFAVGLGLIEAVLRTTHIFGARRSWSQPDEWIRWRFSPGREYWYYSENDHPIAGRINSHGWRDRERSIEKPTPGFRVAVIGDSYVAAFEVEAESTMCAIAERKLRAEHRSAEVLNFGRVGMTLTEELIVLDRDVIRFDPDVVVIVFAPINDIRDVDRRTAVPVLRPFFVDGPDGKLAIDRSFRENRGFRLRSMVNTVKQQNALFSLASERYNAMRFAQRQAQVDAPTTIVPGVTTMSRHLTLCTENPDDVYSRNYTLCKRLIAIAATTCDERGVRFVLVGINTVYLDEKIAVLESVDPTFDPAFFDTDLEAMADTSGFTYVALQSAFRARYLETGRRLHWAHWNYAGNRLAADSMLGAIRP